MSEPRTPNPLLARLGRALAALLERALALDPQMREQLAAIEGRRIGIELRGTGLALAIEARGGSLHVGPHWAQPSNLNLRAAPASLLAFALRRNGDASPQPPGKVEISGDADLARRLEKLFRNYRPDIQEAFARPSATCSACRSRAVSSARSCGRANPPRRSRRTAPSSCARRAAT